MPISKNYHTHTKLCGHAEGDIIDYIEMAIKSNYTTLGFSEHAPLPLEAFNDIDLKRLYAYENMSIATYKNEYLDALKKYKHCYKDKIELLTGLESEYLYGYDDFYHNLYKDLDYMILGVHFFNYENRLIDTYHEINNKTMYGYLECIKKALNTKMFKILAHPDLFLYNNIEFNDDAKYIAKEIINECIKNDVLVEINCNGKNKYPRHDFYEYIKDMNAKYIIGVDAHDPNRLNGEHIESVIKLAKDLKLNVVNLEVK